MKKTHSLNKYSHYYLFLLLYKTLLRRGFFRVLLFLIVLFSVKSYSQEKTISGLENIHISDGAIVVNEVSDEVVIIHTSHSTITYHKPQKDKFDTKIAKNKIVKQKKNKIKEKNKIIEKEKSLNNFVCNKNNPKNSFLLSNSIEKNGISNTTNYNNIFLKPEINSIILLRNHQVKENVLYLFYHSKKVNNSLFARPPPSSNFI